MHNMEKWPLCHMLETVNGEGSDEHVHPVSLIWAFSVCHHILNKESLDSGRGKGKALVR